MPEIINHPTKDTCWRAKCVEIPALQYGGDHHIYVFARKDGKDVRDGSLAIRWGWKGQNGDESAPSIPLDKPHPEPCANLPIEKGQEIWLSISDPSGVPSDIVRGVRADFDTTQPGSGWHHHSYEAIFEKVVVAPKVINNPPAPPEQPAPPRVSSDIAARFTAIAEELRLLGLDIEAQLGSQP